MAKKRKVARRAWTKDDLRILKSMAKDKRGAKKIAKASKRSPGATTVGAAARHIVKYEVARRLATSCALLRAACRQIRRVALIRRKAKLSEKAIEHVAAELRSSV